MHSRTRAGGCTGTSPATPPQRKGTCWRAGKGAYPASGTKKDRTYEGVQLPNRHALSTRGERHASEGHISVARFLPLSATSKKKKRGRKDRRKAPGA
ncbi:hypothetical protein NDU88_003866 [Pleurodeles waltl]|uniref:Uncharacterized protein n=1 Tax=Pleurodeles waltl TaxID=8319 RepID=A0AAV7LK37_PLEWA|nr:hypothetical protein NDU88_003866 [Pleurodeles waltl]